MDFQGNGRKQRTGPLLPASDPLEESRGQGAKRFLKGLLVVETSVGSGALEAEENCTRGDSPEKGLELRRTIIKEVRGHFRFYYKSVFLLGITSGNGDLSRKREHLHALSLLDDLFPVAVVKSLAVYGIFTLLVNTLCEDRTQTVLQKLLVTRSRLVNTSCKLPLPRSSLSFLRSFAPHELTGGLQFKY